MPLLGVIEGFLNSFILNDQYSLRNVSISEIVRIDKQKEGSISSKMKLMKEDEDTLKYCIVQKINQRVLNSRAIWHIFKLVASIFSLKKLCYIFSYKNILKKFIPFSQKKFFLTFLKLEISNPKIKKFKERTFRVQKD